MALPAIPAIAWWLLGGAAVIGGGAVAVDNYQDNRNDNLAQQGNNLAIRNDMMDGRVKIARMALIGAGLYVSYKALQAAGAVK
jgi:hypothetical protein